MTSCRDTYPTGNSQPIDVGNGVPCISDTRLDRPIFEETGTPWFSDPWTPIPTRTDHVRGEHLQGRALIPADSWHHTHSLSHASSISSLNSLYSVPLVPKDEINQDFVHEQPISATYITKDTLSGWTMPMPNSRQPLQIQTRDLDRIRKVERSASFCSSESEDLQVLLSTASTRSTGSDLAMPLTKLSLHHRRASSTNLRHKQPSYPGLHRSASMIVKKSEPVADEDESAIKQNLSFRALEVKSSRSGAQADKLKTLWVRYWLQSSYTISAGSTVPRQALYASYVRSCQEYGIPAANPAPFGKAVRNAFPSIKTRRLGHRGNSKYNYISLCPATRVEVERLNEYANSSARFHAAPGDGAVHPQFVPLSLEEEEDMEHADIDGGYDGMEAVFEYSRVQTSSGSHGTMDACLSIPNQIEAQSIFGKSDPHPHSPKKVYSTNVRNLTFCEQVLWSRFVEFLERLTACVRNLNFGQFEDDCRNFWTHRSLLEMQIAPYSEVSVLMHQAYETATSQWITTLMDQAFEDRCLGAQRALHGFALNFETLMEQFWQSGQAVWQNVPASFCQTGFDYSVRFAGFLRRFTALGRLNNVLSSIFMDHKQVASMSRAWALIDEHSIAQQCALAGDCKPEQVASILYDFSSWLSELVRSQNLDRSSSLQSILSLGRRIHTQLAGMSGVRQTLAGRVAFLTSQTVRELTLRSDPSFGAYQLLKTWIDDWAILVILYRFSSPAQTAFSTGDSADTWYPGDVSVSDLGYDHSAMFSTVIPTPIGNPHLSYIISYKPVCVSI